MLHPHLHHLVHPVVASAKAVWHALKWWATCPYADRSNNKF
jgi:hypothetical protein